MSVLLVHLHNPSHPVHPCDHQPSAPHHSISAQAIRSERRIWGSLEWPVRQLLSYRDLHTSTLAQPAGSLIGWSKSAPASIGSTSEFDVSPPSPPSFLSLSLVLPIYWILRAYHPIPRPTPLFSSPASLSYTPTPPRPFLTRLSPASWDSNYDALDTLFIFLLFFSMTTFRSRVDPLSRLCARAYICVCMYRNTPSIERAQTISFSRV